jgi:uncharacterized protein YceK
MHTALAIATLGLLLTGCASNRRESAAPKPDATYHRVLIIDGQNNHDWPRATAILKAVLEDSGLFTVEVSTTPPRDAWATWRPAFANYDAVVSNFNGGHTAKGVHWPREVEGSLEDYVTSGGGLVIFQTTRSPTGERTTK